MINQEVLKERERIREIIIKKIDAVINYRLETIKHKKKGISDFERLKDNILFLVDNPDYIKKSEDNLKHKEE